MKDKLGYKELFQLNKMMMMIYRLMQKMLIKEYNKKLRVQRRKNKKNSLIKRLKRQ